MAKIIIPDSYRKWDSEIAPATTSAPVQHTEQATPIQHTEAPVTTQQAEQVNSNVTTDDPVGYMLELFKNNRAAEAFAFGEEHAKKGDVMVMAYLCVYYWGEGYDYKKAVHWGLRALQHPDYTNILNVEVLSVVYCSLGDCYINGKGVEEDKRLGIKYLKLSAENGFEEAMRVLGYHYLEGIGILQDYNDAFYWYKKAADAGDALAQGMIGYMYQHAQGVEFDLDEALYWYRTALKQGNEDVKEDLGFVLLDRGFLIESDEEAAWVEEFRSQLADRIMGRMQQSIDEINARKGGAEDGK